jgi:HK97 family phage major capsid protein
LEKIMQTDTCGRLVPASLLMLLARGRDWFAGAVADGTVEAHRTRQTELLDSCTAMIAQADAERRELTAEEQGTIDANNAEVDRLERQVALRERTMANAERLRGSTGRAALPDQLAHEDDDAPAPARPTAQAPRAPEPRPSVPAAPRATAAGTAGFRHMGDFARAVRFASAHGGQVDQRLMNAAASTFSQEGVGADGGFLVPPDFSAEILRRVFAEDALVTRCDVQVCSSNTWKAPRDETTPWGTSGVKAYWTAEAAAITQSKPSFGEMAVALHKVTSLVPVTEEQLEDAANIDGYLRSKMPEAIDWEISDAIVNGSGVGKPLGLLNSPALLQQAKESGQTADTFVAENAVKMMARMPVRSRATAVWLIHPDIEAFLPLMKIGDTPVYLPPGGLSGNQYGMLLGRPVIPHQACQAIGDKGDVYLVNFGEYLIARKAAGVRVQTSMHLWFDQDISAFKATMRLGGQPWWAATMADKNGSGTRSPYICLEAR